MLHRLVHLQGGAARRGFTLIELLISILVIFTLIGLLLVGGRLALRAGRSSNQAQTVRSMRLGVEQFKREFGFLPPLARDFGPTDPIITRNINGRNLKRPNVYAFSLDATNALDRDMLRGYPGGSKINFDSGDRDLRYSTLSLPWYLSGVLDLAEDTSVPIGSRVPVDGSIGPRTTEPRPDGSFVVGTPGRPGRRYGPYFDTGRGGNKLTVVDAAAGRYEIQDAKGVAFRYYRWLRGRSGQTSEITRVNNTNQFNPDWMQIPFVVADLSAPGSTSLDPTVENLNARGDITSAEFAIVGAGPNGVFGDEPIDRLREAVGGSYDPADPFDRARLRREAQKDNVVEVGR